MKRKYDLKPVIFVITALLIFIGCIYSGIKIIKKVQQTSSSGVRAEANKTDSSSLEGGDSSEGNLSNRAADGRQNNYSDNFLENDKYVVMLDAGHGGKDEGTHYDEIYEKDITLDVVNYMKDYLEDAGVTVLLTRSDDTFYKLKERTDMANEQEADLFVSVHCNYYEDDSAISGFECYYCDDGYDSKIYAEKIVRHMEEVGDGFVRGTRQENFFVLENTKCSSVLLELGYLSNSTERRNLSNPGYQKEMARQLVDGILQGFVPV